VNRRPARIWIDLWRRPPLIGNGIGLDNQFQINAETLSTSNTTTTLHNSMTFSPLLTPVIVEDDNTLIQSGQIGNGLVAPGSVENDLTFSTAATPEPFTFALCGLGLLGVGLLRRRNAK
jgi:hypothetical protein